MKSITCTAGPLGLGYHMSSLQCLSRSQGVSNIWKWSGSVYIAHGVSSFLVAGMGLSANGEGKSFFTPLSFSLSLCLSLPGGIIGVSDQRVFDKSSSDIIRLCSNVPSPTQGQLWL